MTHLVFLGAVTLISFLSFLMGGLVVADITERKLKRKLRKSRKPAQSKIQRLVKVQHFTVQPGAMDVHFPNTEGRL